MGRLQPPDQPDPTHQHAAAPWHFKGCVGDVGPCCNQLCLDLECPDPTTHKDAQVHAQTHFVSSSREARDQVAMGQDSAGGLLLRTPPFPSFSLLFTLLLLFFFFWFPMYMSPVTMGPSHIGPPGRVSVVWSASGPRQWRSYLPGLLLRTKFPGTLCQEFGLR